MPIARQAEPDERLGSNAGSRGCIAGATPASALFGNGIKTTTLCVPLPCSMPPCSKVFTAETEQPPSLVPHTSIHQRHLAMFSQAKVRPRARGGGVPAVLCCWEDAQQQWELQRAAFCPGSPARHGMATSLRMLGALCVTSCKSSCVCAHMHVRVCGSQTS
jgi:hypothetical protein